MTELSFIVKRNGEKQLFNSDRIFNAINKAFISESINDNDKVLSLTKEVIELIDLIQNERSNYITVEEVQDLVEQTLMNHSLHKIARNYILYRDKQKHEREEKTLTKIKENQLNIKVNESETIIYNPSQIEEKLTSLSEGLSKISVSELVDNITKQVYDNIPLEEVNQIILNATREKIEQHYEYSSLASRLTLDQLYSTILKSSYTKDDFEKKYQDEFKNYIKTGIELELLNEKLSEFDLDKIVSHINPKRDLLFHYLGIQILVDRYFIKNREFQTIELPQWFWLRVSMGLALKEKNKEEKTIEFYNVLSKMDLVSSTPTLFNSGTRFSQMSSCYLNLAEDSLEGIFKLFSDNAKLSKWAGGIGSDWSYIRATGSKIKGTNGSSQGVIPFIKIFNDVALAVNQGGKRKGAMCAYLELWHLDIEQFFELRKNTGDERRRTHDINTACWIPDLFMKRLNNDQDWTLFCPADTPDLHDSYGKEFEQKFIAYEQKKGIRKKTIKASELWRKLLTMLYETGHPWVTFKDPCNIRSPQDHVGVVHSSNLCTEITLNTSKDETAVCNLASINLANMITNGSLDEEKIETTIATGIRMLDNVIDNNFYPTIESERANLRHRAIGLGMMGYQDALYKLNYAFESNENLEFADESMEMISYYAILASSKLAQERGSYESFKGSKWDRGIFPIDTIDILEEERGDTIDIDRKKRLNWDFVKNHVKEHGLRNSNLMAIAPTATIANISGTFPCTEPAFKNMYMKENLSGNFIVMNRYLIDDLDKLNLWNSDMVKALKLHNGSVMQIAEIPENIKNKYKETFEINMDWLLKSAAKRMKWIDQSASTNVFLKTQSGKILSNVYQLAWKLGLKTTYYLRTLAATQVTKTIEIEQKNNEPLAPTKPATIVDTTSVCSILDPSCEACQ